MKLYTWFPVQFLVFQSDLIDQGIYSRLTTELLVLRLRLPEFKYLVDQVQQADRTLVDHGYLLRIAGRSVLRFNRSSSGPNIR